MKNTTVGVDLAKDVIQVCVCVNKKVQSNPEILLILAKFTVNETRFL
jgi:hypothetical protein